MKEVEKRPFEDTKKAYQLGVEVLIARHPSIAMGDLLTLQESQSGVVADVPDATSISRPHRKIGRRTPGIPLSVPMHKEDLPKSLKTHNMAQVYLFGEEVLEDVGNMFDVTSEDVRLSTKRGVKKAIELVQHAGYDFDSLNFRKPRRRKTPIYKFPIYRDWRSTIALLTDITTDKRVVKELILEIPKGVYSYYRNIKDNPEGIFFNLMSVVIKAGLRPDVVHGELDFIINYLRCNSFPLGHVEVEIKNGKRSGRIQRYNFTTLNFVDEAVELLKSAQGRKFDRMRERFSTGENVV